MTSKSDKLYVRFRYESNICFFEINLGGKYIIPRPFSRIEINNLTDRGRREGEETQRKREGKRSPLPTQPPAGLSAGLQDFSPVIVAAITTNYGDNYRHYAVQ